MNCYKLSDFKIYKELMDLVLWKVEGKYILVVRAIGDLIYEIFHSSITRFRNRFLKCGIFECLQRYRFLA